MMLFFSRLETRLVRASLKKYLKAFRNIPELFNSTSCLRVSVSVLYARAFCYVISQRVYFKKHKTSPGFVGTLPLRCCYFSVKI